MGQVPKLFERPQSVLAKLSGGSDQQQQQQMNGRLPFAAGKKQARPPQQSRHKGQLKVSQKSICVDAEELRRRLNIVLLEQNNRKARHHQRSASALDGPVHNIAREDVAISASRYVLDTTGAKQHSSIKAQQPPRPASALAMTARPQEESSSANREGKKDSDVSPAKTVARSSSRAALDQDRQNSTKRNVRRSYSTSSLSHPPEEGANAQSHYVPRNAAAHFANTATTQSMQKKHLIHPLAREAFEKQERVRLAERASFDATSLTNKMWSLRRAQNQQRQSAVYERNQFQEGSLMLAPGGQRRNTVHGTGFDTIAEYGMDNIFEDEEFVASQKRQAGRGCQVDSTADFVNIVNDRRIDWTQTDEVEKKRSSILFAFRMKKPAETKFEPAALQSAGATNRSKLRLSKLPSKIDLSQSTGALPMTELKSPKSPLAFFSKFKRQQFIKV